MLTRAPSLPDVPISPLKPVGPWNSEENSMNYCQQDVTWGSKWIRVRGAAVCGCDPWQQIGQRRNCHFPPQSLSCVCPIVKQVSVSIWHFLYCHILLAIIIEWLSEIFLKKYICLYNDFITKNDYNFLIARGESCTSLVKSIISLHKMRWFQYVLVFDFWYRHNTPW